MLKRLRFRPLGWLAVIGTLAAMAGTIAALAPGAAVAGGAEKEYSATFKVPCIIGPGVLNIKATGESELTASVSSKGPATVENGTEMEFTEGHTSITSPASLAESFVALGVTKVSGFITNFPVNFSNGSPSELNICEIDGIPRRHSV